MQFMLSLRKNNFSEFRNECEMSQIVEILGTVNFITQYRGVFGLSDVNLNGVNPYKFSKYLLKRSLIWEASKNLVFNELALPLKLDNGLKYIITL